MVDFAYKRKIVFYKNKIKWLKKQLEAKPKDFTLKNELAHYQEALVELLSCSGAVSYSVEKLHDACKNVANVFKKNLR